MNRYQMVRGLYKRIDSLPEELAVKVKTFHLFREAYQQGSYDVIGGLQAMDRMSEEILSMAKEKGIDATT